MTSERFTGQYEPKTSIKADDIILKETIYEIISYWGRNYPNDVAIEAPDSSPLTFGQLLNQIRYVQSSLNELGIGREDVVAIILPNGPDLAVLFLGVASCSTSAPLNTQYTESEFQFYLTDLQAKAIIVEKSSDSPAISVALGLDIKIIELDKTPESPAGIFKLDGERARVKNIRGGFAESSDIALMLHTSGTTSRPKVVPLSHNNICYSARNICNILELSRSDKCLNVMPLFHIHSLVGTSLPSFLAGASVIYTPNFDVLNFYKWFDKYKPTWFTGSPTIHQAVLAFSDEHRTIIQNNNLRFIRSSSAPLPPTVLINLEKNFNAPVIESYGMTEAAYLIASNPLPPKKRKIGSVGRPVGLSLAIMDSGRLLKFGEVGEIVLQGINVIQSYGHESDNENAFVDGWFLTGDQGYIDKDGYVFITGRLKEIINRGGEKISPRQIDEVILEHPDVREAVAFAVENELLGEEVAAAVVLEKGSNMTEYDLQLFIQEKLAYFKVPKFILILDELPKGPTGKVQRIGMAERLAVLMGDKEKVEQNPRKGINEIMARMLSDVPLYSYAESFDEGSHRSSRNRGISLILGEVSTKLPRIMSESLNTPLLEKMSEFYSSKMRFQKTHGIIGLQTRGSRLPIFLVHDSDGTMDYSLSLLENMDISQPIYGFRARGLDALDQPFKSIELMADYYISEIRKVQKHGPYILGGYHIGGLIAYEMAQKLIWQGETVDKLIMIETLPRVYRNINFIDKLKLGISKLFCFGSWLKEFKNLGLDSMDIEARMRERVTNYSLMAAKRYEEKPYPGDVILLVSEKCDNILFENQLLINEWGKWINGRLYSYTLTGSDDDLNSTEISNIIKQHIYGI